MAIIESFLDLDLYKLTMGQFIFHRYLNGVLVTSGFTNRTKDVKLAHIIPVITLRSELDALRDLRYQDRQIEYLASIKTPAGTPMFRDDYLEFLQCLRLGEYIINVKPEGQYGFKFPGPWVKQTYWETLALSVVNELYYRITDKDPAASEAEGEKRLDRKIQILKNYPDIKILEFGTRRRYSRGWQEKVLTKLVKEIPDQVVGTSNVELAMKLGIPARGTMAHELFMVAAALADTQDGICSSHNRILREWWDEYGDSLSVALTDTFGTDFFFKDFTPSQAEKWRGLRQDSGDPFIFGEKAKAFYKGLGIDTHTKQLVFSDGLEIETIIAIWERFHSDFQIVFGWGTNLTNDCGLDALSLVVKAILANGNGTVKLSDNSAKAQGSEINIQFYKTLFNYSVNLYEKTVY